MDVLTRWGRKLRTPVLEDLTWPAAVGRYEAFRWSSTFCLLRLRRLWGTPLLVL